MGPGGKPFIPRADGAFDAWVAAFWPAVQAFYNDHGLDVDELNALEDALAVWSEQYPLHTAAQAAALAARQAKDAARADLDAAIRPIVRFVQTFPSTTDADRATLGITLKAPGTGNRAMVTSRPLALVQSGQRLTHQLRLVDESAPLSSRGGRPRRAKPKGVQRAELFVALTPPGRPVPTPPPPGCGDAGAYRYVGSVTGGETTLSFEPDQGGMQAHYIARWVTTSGASGPWSDTASATVAA